MQKFALMSACLGCLACRSHTSEVEASTVDIQRYSMPESWKLTARGDPGGTFKSARIFTRLLLALNPAVAFNPFALRVTDMYTRPGHRIASEHALARRSPISAMSSPKEDMLKSAFWDDLCTETKRYANELGEEIRQMTFTGGKLIVVSAPGAIQETEKLSTYISNFIDTKGANATNDFPPYVLEVSSPGLSDVLLDDQYFITFKSFPVTVYCKEPFKNKKAHEGRLIGRDEEFVRINKDGKPFKIPRSVVHEVRLPRSGKNDHDVYKIARDTDGKTDKQQEEEDEFDDEELWAKEYGDK